jgi:hypothetical protein
MFVRECIILYLILNVINADIDVKNLNNSLLFDKYNMNNVIFNNYIDLKSLFLIAGDKYENKKCYNDITLTINGVFNYEHWALSSK